MNRKEHSSIEDYIRIINDKDKELAYMASIICHYQAEISEKDRIINNLIDENRLLLAQVNW